MESDDFHGCKIALFDNQQRVLVFLRDDKPDIESPNMWDLPGGGREGNESPESCVLRELYEEFGPSFSEERLLYKRRYHREHRGRSAYYFVGSVSSTEADSISFGEEGQRWTMMPVDLYLEHPQVVPRHKVRMQDYLETV